MLCRAGLEKLDCRLASLTRVGGALELRIGQLLEALGRPDVSGSTGYAELGFSAMSEYVRERVERSRRWGEAARCMARRLERLPAVRGALAGGVISWSMAEQVARIATLEDEVEWLSQAEKMTVREMRKLVQMELARRAAPASPGEVERDRDRERAEEMVTLRLTVDQEDLWIWHATKTLMEVGLDTYGSDEQAGALLGETMSTLMNCLPDGVIDWCALSEEVPEWRDPREASYRLMRGEWQAEAEERCECGVTESAREQPAAAVMDPIARLAARGSVTLDGLPAKALDPEVRALARRLAAQELELARGLLALHRSNGWRRLGYASEQQYARERLGLSRSLVAERRSLALKLEKLPAVASALEQGSIGIQAAASIAKVATPATEFEWIERATRRTVKHLREETDAAGMARRVSDTPDCPPPTDQELDTFQELERAVVSGRVLWGEKVELGAPTAERGEPRRAAWHRALGSLVGWLEGGIQTSAAPRRLERPARSAGRVEVSLRMSRANYALWHALEAQVRRVLHLRMSFLKFLCLVIWEEERHVVSGGGATSVMVRDRGRCSSPVCCRHDVQEHHLLFRSHGGGDEPWNRTSLCFRCHLRGIHLGRIEATTLDGRIRWVIGREPILVVEGREKRAA